MRRKRNNKKIELVKALKTLHNTRISEIRPAEIKEPHMLKLYVECVNRLSSSAQTLKDRRGQESGFISAEAIAIAVAGVLIVGGVYVAFRTQLNTAITNLFTDIGSWS